MYLRKERRKKHPRNVHFRRGAPHISHKYGHCNEEDLELLVFFKFSSRSGAILKKKMNNKEMERALENVCRDRHRGAGYDTSPARRGGTVRETGKSPLAFWAMVECWSPKSVEQKYGQRMSARSNLALIIGNVGGSRWGLDRSGLP